MARRAPYGKAPPTWQRPYIMRWIEAASAGTPARAQPAPPLIRLWRFPCPFQRRTAERYKGAAISVLTLPCQDGTDSSNPLSSSGESGKLRPPCAENPEPSCRGTRSWNPSPSSVESAANLTSSIRIPRRDRLGRKALPRPHQDRCSARRLGPTLCRNALASAFVARWCAGYKIETAEGAFRIRTDEPTMRITASLHRTP
jgi:hypothetical protein